MRPEPEVRQHAKNLPMPPVPAPAQPVPRSLRLVKAYWVTFVVIASYTRFRLFARFRTQEGAQRVLREKHRLNARRIYRAMHELQGLYIKVGQLLSILTNFLPEEFRRELEGLQDRVAPRPYPEIQKRLIEQLGGESPREVFAEFEEMPIASASIAQVHRARLRSGEQVAVKVQYPDIEEMAKVDLHALRRIFGVIGSFLSYPGMEDVYREIRSMVLTELDFHAEADGLERVAANFKGRTNVSFPKVFRELSSQRVLVTEWIEGVKVSDVAALESLHVNRKALARLIVETYCKQIFTDGVYHADPHPGNIFVRPGMLPHIVFLDFGAVAEVSPKMRQGLVEFIQGALARDTTRLAAALRTMGFVARTADPQMFERVVDFFHQRFQEEIQLDTLNLRDVKLDPKRGLEHLADLRRMDISLRDITESFHVPKEWIVLERTLLLLMGLCTSLDPAMNPMEVIRPYIEEFVLGKDRDPSRLLMTTTKDIAMSAIALPSDIRKFLGRAMRGELVVRFHGIDDNAKLIYSAGQQLVFTLIGISSVAFGLILEEKGEEQRALVAFSAAVFCGLALLGSMMGGRSIKKIRRRR